MQQTLRCQRRRTETEHDRIEHGKNGLERKSVHTSLGVLRRRCDQHDQLDPEKAEVSKAMSVMETVGDEQREPDSTEVGDVRVNFCQGSDVPWSEKLLKNSGNVKRLHCRTMSGFLEFR